MTPKITNGIFLEFHVSVSILSFKFYSAAKTTIARQLKPTCEPSVALTNPFGDNVKAAQNATERHANTKSLIKICPELQPAASSLPVLASTSEYAGDSPPCLDPAVSELLAFGHLKIQTKGHDIEELPILAAAGGPAGELVRLVLLTKEFPQWKGKEGVYLNSLTCKAGQESTWRPNGSPIQQLQFSEPEAVTSSWLAVRYHGAIAILHPHIIPEDSVSVRRSISDFQSCLDPNPVVILYSERSQRVPFADVAFNPWNQKQIATIDQGGHWNLWTLRNVSPQRCLWAIEKGFGDFTYRNTGGEEQLHALEDGWGAVMWAGNRDRLLAVSRKSLSLFDVKSNAIRLDVPIIISKTSAERILNVKRSPLNKNQIFIATTSALYWLLIAASDDRGKPGAQFLLAWKHFIDPEDISLRLNFLRTPEESADASDSTGTKLLTPF